jgi:hypothetical protein
LGGKAVIVMRTQIIETDGISLYSESFGTPTDPPILPIMGAKVAAIWWPEACCCQL